MARLIFPDEASRLVYHANGLAAVLAIAETATFYSDSAGTILADLRTYDGTLTPGAPITGSKLTIDTYSRVPLFWGPDGADTVYAVVTGGPVTPVYAREDDRIDALATSSATNAAAIAAETSARTSADATLTTNVAANAAAIAAETTARAAAITAEVTARAAADATLTTNVATNATAIAAETTVRTAGDALAAQKASNLSDLASAATARTNLGLGTAATMASTAFALADAADFYPESYGTVTGDATTAVRAALAAAIAVAGRLRFQEGKTYVTDMLSVTGACSIYIPATTTVQLKNTGTEVSGLLTVFKITASNVALVCPGWIDANRAGQDQTAFNAAGGANGGKGYFGVRVQGTSVTPLTNVVIDARIKNSADLALSVYYASTGCAFTVHATACGAGASISDSSDFGVPLVDLWSLDNIGWKVFPHAFDLIRCVRPTIGTVSVRDHFGTGTVGGGTSLSDYVSGITFVDVQDGTIGALSAASRSDVTMRSGVGISWLSVRRCTLGSFAILGYTSVGFEMGGVVGCQVSSGVIDGRYQSGAGSPVGRGWSLYNNGYYGDFAGRSQRFTEYNQFTDIRVVRCLDAGIYQSAGRFNTFTNVNSSGNVIGIRQEIDVTSYGQSFPGQSLVDLEGNTFIGCEFSYNEQYGTRFVDARSAKLIACRANNNGQSLNYVVGNGRTRRLNTLVTDTAGFNFVTSGAAGSVKSGITLTGCEAVDDQTWNESVSFNPANPTVIYPAITGRYHVGQTIKLFGAGPGGVGVNLYTRINSVELDAVTISDAIVVTTTVAGTGTIATAGAAVTGAGSTFTTDIRDRFFIVAGGQTRQVAAVTDDTHMTVTAAFSPDLAAGTAFTIYKTPSGAIQSQKYGAEFSADTVAPRVIGGTYAGNITASFLDSTVQTPTGLTSPALRVIGVAGQVSDFTGQATIAESDVTSLVADLAAKQATGNYVTALTGDATASGPGSAAVTFATVNTNTGSWGDASHVPQFTVNAKGLVTAAANVSIVIASGSVTGLGSLATVSSLTGPITSTGAATAVTANAITNAMLAQMPTLTVKGNNTGGTANALDLTVAQLKTLLALTESDIASLVTDLAAKASRAGPDPMPSGEGSMDRAELNSAAVTTGTGSLRGRFFTARTSTLISQIKMYSGSTLAVGTPTLVRVGLWTTSDAGVLATLVASTPNDTTLLAATNTAYTKALSATYTMVPGQRYYAGLLYVTAGTAPTMVGNATTGGATVVAGVTPMMAGQIGSLADLPANGTVGGSALAPYIELLP